MVFKEATTWKGQSFFIDVIMDHKNLEYFSTTKILSHYQVRWFRIPLPVQPCYSLLSETSRIQTQYYYL